ncbi:helix-turn-helix domain-containing protein [Bacillus sp. AFS040349]|uniref:helix-turn-helix domain-containing protein n=1 Tax=Bacillus sp. AFS040349 TaxID=2033502 RepID=UPI000BFD6C43|nr:helix-turn-helix domain-containing protein [Bacillus sp. AFS040349]PGT79156.1 DNA-binding protein [Bacillus sp. AFS040349]
MLLLKDLPEYITPKQIKQFLRIGQRQAYQLIKTKDFQNMKLADINFFSKEKFIKWLEGGSFE